MEKKSLRAITSKLMKLNKLIYTIEKYLLVLSMYGLVIVMFINVLFRFVFFIPSAWADELSRYIFTWLILIGAAVAMYNMEHIDINLIDSIIKKLTKGDESKFSRAMLAIRKNAIAITTVFLVYLLIEYGKYLKKVAQINLRSLFLGVGLVVPMSAIYICSALMIFHAVCYLIIPEIIRKEEG